MKTLRKTSLVLTAILLAMALLLVAVAATSGIRHVYFRHVIATVEFSSLESGISADALREYLNGISGFRSLDFARTSWAPNTWMARIQFQAPNRETAARRLHEWMASLPADCATARLVKASYYDCRLSRPNRGDIVLGKTFRITLAPR